MTEIWDKKKSFVYTLSRDVSPESFYNHTHNAYELYFFLRGEAEYVIEGVSYELKPGSMSFVRAMDYHYVQLRSGSVYERAVIHFEPDCGYDDLAGFLNGSFVLGPAQTDGLLPVINKLIRAAEEYSPEDARCLLEGAIKELLLQLKYLGIDIRNKELSGSAAAACARYINANLELPMNLSDLAERLYLSPSYLSHAFKKHFKTPLMTYIREKKIRYAASLIAKGMPPTAACLQCGFNNYSTFYRQFKRINGYLPSGDGTVNDLKR